MKKRFNLKYKIWKTAAILFLQMFFLSVGICTSAEDSSKVSFEIKMNDTAGAHLPRAEAFEIMTYSAESSGWSYGSQLYGNAEQIYYTLAEISNMRAYTTRDTIFIKLQDPYIFTSIQGRLNAEDDLARAIHAFIKDYGEYYWLDAFAGWILSGSDEAAYSYSEVQLVPRDYYSGIRSELTEADAALQQAIDTVKEEPDRYAKVKAAHDYVIKLIQYNNSDPYADYGHTITGGLLSKYDHRAVCECYAKLFKLLCNANGIPCILVTGGSSLDTIGNVIADHMWNYVQMEDGMWYLIDTTWDDTETEFPDYTYFLAGSDSMGNYGVTVEDDHIPVGRFNDDVEYEPFVVPVLAEKSYLSSYDADIPVQSITLKETSLRLDAGQGKYVSVKEHYPKQANTGLNYHYSSSDPSVAEVSSTGYVTGKIAGKATITVSSGADDSVKAVCKVTVRDHVFDKGVRLIEPTFTSTGEILYTCAHGCGETKKETLPVKIAYVRLNAVSIPLQVGKTTTALKITGCDPSDSVASWTSSDKKVAKVNRRTGKIAAKKKGRATITVTMKSGAKAKCVVKVQKGIVKTKQLSLSRTSITLKKNKTYKLKVERTPITANDKLKYFTSNKSVATVSSSGRIKAKKKGSATITVKAASGKKVKIKVKVS